MPAAPRRPQGGRFQRHPLAAIAVPLAPDDVLAPRERKPRSSRGGRALAPARAGPQGVRLGTAVSAERAPPDACPRGRQRRRCGDRNRPSRALRRCDAGRRRPALPGLPRGLGRWLSPRRLPTGRIASVGFRVRVLDCPGGRALSPPGHARGRLLVPTGAALFSARARRRRRSRSVRRARPPKLASMARPSSLRVSELRRHSLSPSPSGGLGASQGGAILLFAVAERTGRRRRQRLLRLGRDG